MSSDAPGVMAPRTTRVVVAYDGSSPARAALDEGARRARDLGAPLLLVCAVEVADPVSVTAFTQAAQDCLLAALLRCQGELGLDDVRTQVVYGRAHHAVLRVVRSGDLVVVGTHGHRPLAGVLLGSTSSTLVTACPCPVLVVRRGADLGSPVVVGVDGSPTSRAAVEVAAAEADASGAVLRAVTAVPPYLDTTGSPHGPDASELDRAGAHLAEALAGLHGRYPDLVVERVVRTNRPVEVLVRASRDARLLVVGSRGRGTLRAVLLGSVGREVVQRAGCSVLVVRPGTARGAAPGHRPARARAR